MRNQRQLTRNELERKVKTLEKEKESIGTWFEKKQAQLDKNLEIVRKKGLFPNVSFEELTEENRDEFNREMWKEIENAPTTTPKTIINKMWSIHNMIYDWASKKQRLINIDKHVEKYEQEIKEVYGELTQDQVRERERVKKEKELYNYLRTEMANIKSESLDKWLAEYKKMYVDWVEENFEGYKRTSRLERAEEIVNQQKLTILVKSFPKVGMFKELKIAHLGMDGTFNGVVIGEKGTCEIETILAGGYNIQVLHFRVLVK